MNQMELRMVLRGAIEDSSPRRIQVRKAIPLIIHHQKVESGGAMRATEILRALNEGRAVVRRARAAGDVFMDVTVVARAVADRLSLAWS